MRLSALLAMPAAGRGRALDGLRGVAVILTYLVHACSFFLVGYRGGNPNSIALMQWPSGETRLLYWLYHSHHGVFIFFVLSGFLIGKLVFKDAQFSYGLFLRNRLLRIYPAFLLALAATLLLTPYDRPPFDAATLLGNLVFLNALPPLGIEGYVANNVTWSLFYEFAFYLSFPLIAFVARTRLLRTLAVLTYGFAAALLPSWLGIDPELFVLFAAGALAAVIPKEKAARIDGRIPDWALLLAYLSITTAYAMGWIDLGHFMILFAAVGALVVFKAAYSAGPVARILAWPPLVWLGGISYSFYLVHSLALLLLMRFGPNLQRAPFRLQALLFLGGGFVIATVLAALSFAVAERFYFGRRRQHPTPVPRRSEADYPLDGARIVGSG